MVVWFWNFFCGIFREGEFGFRELIFNKMIIEYRRVGFVNVVMGGVWFREFISLFLEFLS